jgi:phage FluMu gp28-like protein
MKKDTFDKLGKKLIRIQAAEELVKCVADPIYFLERYAMIQHPCKGAVPFLTYEHQKKLLKSYDKNRFNIVHSARQVGTTTTNAMHAFSCAFLHPYKTIVIVADKLTFARECLSKIRFAHENLPERLRSGNHLIVNNRGYLEFENGSKIFVAAGNGDATKGISANLVIVDNFAFISHTRQEDLLCCIMPTLYDNGSLILSSTTSGNPGVFRKMWEAASKGQNVYVPHLVRWDIIPERDESFKNSMISILGESRWKMEHECIFNS